MPATATAEHVSRNLTVRTFEVRAESWRDNDRSFEVVLATEAPVLVMDMQRWEPVEEVLLMKGCKLPRNRQVPLLDSHDRSSVREGQVGSIRELRVEGATLIGRCYISATEEGIATKVKEGHITDISAGYQARNSVVIEPGQTVEVEGRKFTAGTRPLRVTTEWPIKEGSLCPIGADEGAKIREDAGGMRLPAKEKEGTKMPENTPLPAGAPATPPAAPASAAGAADALKPEIRETAEEILKRRVLAVTPHEFVGVAEQALMDGKGFEECRAAVREAFAKARAGGSGSADSATGAGGGKPGAPKVADVTGDVLVRSLLG